MKTEETEVRSLVGVSRLDRVINEEVCRRAGIETELPSIADQRMEWRGSWRVEQIRKC